MENLCKPEIFKAKKRRALIIGEHAMNFVTNMLNAYPGLRTALDSLSVIIPLSTLLAFSGLGFLSSVARTLGIVRQRNAYEKCSRQLALLWMALGWILIIGGRIWLYYSQGLHKPGTLPSFILELSWLLLSLAVLLASVYYTLWRILKNMPILHITLGFISSIQCLVALAAILASIRLLAAFAHPNSASLDLTNIFPTNLESPLWSAIAYTVPLLFALPGAFGASWLTMRRKRDDFGRDHYNAMLPWCCAWARNAWILLWLILLVASGLELFSQGESDGLSSGNALTASLRILFWLIPALLWTLIIRSKTPLRHKILLFFALSIAVCFTLPYWLDLTAI